MKKYDLFIGGEHVTPASGSWFDSENPYTAEPWAQIPEGNAEDVDKAARAAHDAFHNGPWSDMTPTQRGAILRRIGDVIAERAEQLAKVEVLDNGKLFSEMYGQLAYLPQWFYYFGGLADKIEGTVVPVDKKGYFLYTQRQPRRSRRDHHPVEQSADAARLEAGAGSGRRLHGGRSSRPNSRRRPLWSSPRC